MPKQGQSWVRVETPHYDASSSIFGLMQIKKEVQVEQHAPAFFCFFQTCIHPATGGSFTLNLLDSNILQYICCRT